MQLWTVAHFFSSNLDFPVIKTLERDFFTLSEWNCNVLITGKSNFDEKKWATGQSCIHKEINSYGIGSLGLILTYFIRITFQWLHTKYIKTKF